MTRNGLALSCDRVINVRAQGMPSLTGAGLQKAFEKLLTNLRPEGSPAD